MKIYSRKFLRIIIIIILTADCGIIFYYLKNKKEDLQSNISNKESSAQGKPDQGEKSKDTQSHANASATSLKAQNIPIDVERLNAEHAEDFADILKSVNEPDIPISSSSARPSEEAHQTAPASQPSAEGKHAQLNLTPSKGEEPIAFIASEKDALAIKPKENSLIIKPDAAPLSAELEESSLAIKPACPSIATEPEKNALSINPEELKNLIEHASPAEKESQLKPLTEPPNKLEESHIIFQLGSESSLCQQNVTQGIEAYMLGLQVESAHHFERAFKADPSSPSAACLLLISHPQSIHAKEARAMLKSLRDEEGDFPCISPQEERHLEALAYLLVGNRQAAAQKFEKISTEYRADKLAYLWAIVLFHDHYDSLGQASLAQSKALALAAKALAHWPECPLSAYLSARIEECAPQISAAALKAARLAAEKMPKQGLSSLLLAQLLSRSPLHGDTIEQRSSERLKLIKRAEKAFLRQQAENMLPWTSSANWIRARLQHIDLLFLNKESSKASKLYLDTVNQLPIKDILQQGQAISTLTKDKAKEQAKSPSEQKQREQAQAQAEAEALSAHALQQDAQALFYWEVSSLPLRLALGSLQLSSPTQHARLLLKTPQAPKEHPDAQAINDYKGCLRHALDARYHLAINNKARAELSIKLAQELLQKLHISSLNSKHYSSRSQHSRAVEACQVAIQLSSIYQDESIAQSASNKASKPKSDSPKALPSISARQRDIINDLMPPPSLLLPPSIPIRWSE